MFSTRQQLHNFSLLLGSTRPLFRAQLQHQFQVCLLQPVTLLKFLNPLLKHSSQGNSFRTILNCVESNSGLHWFCITSLCDWSRKLAPLSKAITCKTKSNHDLVARVFPRFWRFVCFYFEVSFALWPLNPEEWPTSTFSLQYHPWIIQ